MKVNKKNYFVNFVYRILSIALPLRYKIKVIGLEKVDHLKKEGGILFLANHSAEVDPAILFKILWKDYKIHPVALEQLFYAPILGKVLKQIGAAPIPNFEDSTNSYKIKQIEKSYESIANLLKKGENVLLYPSGGLKRQAEELIGGASAAHTILNRLDSPKVVLVNTIGLWGSMFSRAIMAKTSDLGAELKKAFIRSLWILLKNGIFFLPKRTVLVEFDKAPENFPYHSSKVQLNRYLEDWFNQEGSEPLGLVSYSPFRQLLLEPIENPIPIETYETEKIPKEIRDKILDEISNVSKIPKKEISVSDHLSKDLGLDSLDMAQLSLFIKDAFDIPEVRPSDFSTVGSLMALASGTFIAKREEQPKKEKIKEEQRLKVVAPQARTVVEAFFNVCTRMGGSIACMDDIAGSLSYKDMKLSVTILAQKLKNIPGRHIGVMLPASCAVNVTVLAILLAGKIPVMMNWTLGKKIINSIIAQTNIKYTLTSWNFVNRLENVDFGNLDEQFIFIENLRKELSLKEKFSGWIKAQKSNEQILSSFEADKIKEEDTAVLLFTSGTENDPKGVPLSHKNILFNQKSALEVVNFTAADVLLGILPPFHSFGFTVTGLLPILSGLKVAYYPNPLDGRGIAQAIKRWQITLLCLAPSFLRNILRASSPSLLESLRLVVVGAEKAPKELFEKMKELNPKTEMMEGYGITECSPVLTFNTSGKQDGSVGKPLPGIDICIVEPDSLKKTTEQGLVLVRGANVFKGYLKKEPNSFLNIEGQLWYNSGDIGYFNKNGNLVLSGRLKRFVKIGGEMISLATIEETLMNGLRKKGVPLDDIVPLLAVVEQEKTKRAEIVLFITFKISLEEANEILKKEGLSNIYRISSVVIVDRIPLLGTGKIDYRSLQRHEKIEKE